MFPRLIQTERLRLRRPEPHEEALCARLAADAYRARPEPPSDERARLFAAFQIEHWVRYGFGFMLADVVTDAGPPQTVGHTGLKYVDAWPGHWAETAGAIELGFSLIPAARGHGYVTEAARAVLAEAFAAFDIPTIRARCNINNEKSAAVLLRCDMTELEATDNFRQFELARPRH